MKLKEKKGTCEMSEKNFMALMSSLTDEEKEEVIAYVDSLKTRYSPQGTFDLPLETPCMN